jgi:hypothetical protein
VDPSELAIKKLSAILPKKNIDPVDYPHDISACILAGDVNYDTLTLIAASCLYDLRLPFFWFQRRT